MVCPGTSGEVGDDASGGQSLLGDVSTGTGSVNTETGQAVTVVCPGTSGEVGDDALGGQSVLGDVSKGAEGDATGGQAVPQVTTFMSYNSTGINQNKCKWMKYVAVEQGVNYAALQEHFKTVKSTAQWFCGQFKEYSTYVTPAYRLTGTANGRG